MSDQKGSENPGYNPYGETSTNTVPVAGEEFKNYGKPPDYYTSTSKFNFEQQNSGYGYDTRGTVRQQREQNFPVE